MPAHNYAWDEAGMLSHPWELSASFCFFSSVMWLGGRLLGFRKCE